MIVDKPTFLAVLREIVEGFESPAFKQAMADAQAKGDVGPLMQLPTEIQSTAFAKHGIDAATGAGIFKAAGKEHGMSPEAAPLLARMKAALGK